MLLRKIFYGLSLVLSGFAVSPASANAIEPDIYDLRFADDSSSGTRNFLSLEIRQSHNLDRSNDQDWLRFSPPLVSETPQVFTITVESVGADIDPRILLVNSGGETVSYNPFNGLPGVFYQQGAGENEILQVSLATDSDYWIRIDTAPGVWGEEAGYEITLTHAAGFPVGMTTITTIRIGPKGGIVPPPPPSTEKTLRARSAGLYQERRAVFATGSTPTLNREQDVSFGAPPDILAPEKIYPATRSWFARPLTDRNHSLIMLQIGERAFTPGIDEFPTPIVLNLQLLGEGHYAVAGDASSEIVDRPEGYVENMARVMVWSPVEREWVVYDPAPTSMGDGVFQTTISTLAPWIDPNSLHEVYFGLEPIKDELQATEPARRARMLLVY